MLKAASALDLSWIEDHLVTRNGFEREDAVRAVDAHRCVMEIAADHPSRAIAPPAIADEALHVHMLNSRRYFTDCQSVFGKYLHHNPEVYGTPAFWEAWDFTRQQFAQRRGIELPTMEQALLGDSRPKTEMVTPYSPTQCLVEFPAQMN